MIATKHNEGRITIINVTRRLYFENLCVKSAARSSTPESDGGSVSACSLVGIQTIDLHEIIGPDGTENLYSSRSRAVTVSDGPIITPTPRLGL